MQSSIIVLQAATDCYVGRGTQLNPSQTMSGNQDLDDEARNQRSS